MRYLLYPLLFFTFLIKCNNSPESTIYKINYYFASLQYEKALQYFTKDSALILKTILSIKKIDKPFIQEQNFSIIIVDLKNGVCKLKISGSLKSMNLVLVREDGGWKIDLIMSEEVNSAFEDNG